MTEVDGSSPDRGSRISLLKQGAERVQDTVGQVRSTIAAAQSSLVSVRRKVEAGAMSTEERAVVDEIGPQLLIAAQRLVDAAQIVATRLEIDFSGLKSELDGAMADGDLRRDALALTAAERRMSALDNLISTDVSPHLEVAVRLRTQLAALDEGA
jgi:hypothetical protein